MSNTIKFTCDLKGCENTKTVGLSAYNKYKKHYCSTDCYHESKRVDLVTITCNDKDCNKTREVQPSKFKEYSKHYCSMGCYNKNRGDRVGNSKTTYTCELPGCEKEKTVYNSVYISAKKHYCSPECRMKGRIGRPKPVPEKETKEMRRRKFIEKFKKTEYCKR